MISELAGADFMINSMESKMLWWHFNSCSTDLKVPETGSRGPAYKLHDNVDPTQGGDLLFIFKSLPYLGVAVFHHAGRDTFIALWATAEWDIWDELAESAISIPPLSRAYLKPHKSASDGVIAPLKTRVPRMKKFYCKRTSKIRRTWAHKWETRREPECLLWGQYGPINVTSMTSLWLRELGGYCWHFVFVKSLLSAPKFCYMIWH